MAIVPGMAALDCVAGCEPLAAAHLSLYSGLESARNNMATSMRFSAGIHFLSFTQARCGNAMARAATAPGLDSAGAAHD